MRVLTWNLFHGRSQPPAGRSLLAHYTRLIAQWEWSVALLQEVPPWFTGPLARAAGAQSRAALTSRSELPAARRAIGERWPDLIKSNGGGANVILVRDDAFVAHERARLRLLPERRVAQIARLRSGLVLANTHLSTAVPRRGGDGRDRARDELARLWSLAGPGPLILGGDLNLFDPVVPDGMGPVAAATHAVDHVFAVGCGELLGTEDPAREVQVGSRTVTLSDHHALIAELSGVEQTNSA
ncbi:MAG TPA: endonuclease/exonuclease/phosphatase family protein [Solirubrobacteraceae bacterium]|nr:endonuclease/exonuclease/phosphatase family protein [Solirubrobacteraceae bacterium]